MGVIQSSINSAIQSAGYLKKIKDMADIIKNFAISFFKEKI